MPASDEFLVRLRQLDSCALSDAADQLGVTAAVSGLSALTVDERICGRVVTVKLAKGTPPPGAPRRHLGAEAVGRAERGEIIVVEQATGLDAAGWGGILSNAARVRGLAGVIVDGPARDINEAAELGFPVFARAATARTARGRIHEAATGEPIRVGEVSVATGDYVVADGSGVVFIPSELIEDMLVCAEAIARREATMTRQVLDGVPASQAMDARYEDMLAARGTR